jgi:hypothetical protein
VSRLEFLSDCYRSASRSIPTSTARSVRSSSKSISSSARVRVFGSPENSPIRSARSLGNWEGGRRYPGMTRDFAECATPLRIGCEHGNRLSVDKGHVEIVPGPVTELTWRQPRIPKRTGKLLSVPGCASICGGDEAD